MKSKFIKSLVLVLISIFSSYNLFSQAFEKGNWNVDLDLGAGAYGVQTTQSIKISGIEVLRETKVDGTASSIFRLRAEYGISNRIGLGLKLGHSNYIISPEDKDTVKSITAVDFAIDFNFHLLNANRNDLFLTLGLGVTNAKWEYQNLPGILLSSATGTGSCVTLGITDRIFFSDHVGMLFNLSYTGYNYKVTPELSSTAKAIVGNLSYTWDIDMALRGVYLGIGLAVKF